jgi:hypothetical protein
MAKLIREKWEKMEIFGGMCGKVVLGAGLMGEFWVPRVFEEDFKVNWDFPLGKWCNKPIFEYFS